MMSKGICLPFSVETGFQFGPVLIVLLLSNSSHEMSAQTAEAGENQGLFADGRGVHQEPGTTQTPGRETGGQQSYTFCVYVLAHINRI